MAIDFYIKQADTLPKIKATLKDSTGAAINLSGGSVAFRMRRKGTTGAPVVDAAGVITGAATGQVEYQWTAANTATVGTYDAEWVVTLGADKETVPNNGHITVQVVDNLLA